MARKRKTVPASSPAPTSCESAGFDRVRIVFTCAHDLDGERVDAGTERNVDQETADSLIARRCARMA